MDFPCGECLEFLPGGPRWSLGIVVGKKKTDPAIISFVSNYERNCEIFHFYIDDYVIAFFNRLLSKERKPFAKTQSRK